MKTSTSKILSAMIFAAYCLLVAQAQAQTADASTAASQNANTQAAPAARTAAAPTQPQVLREFDQNGVHYQVVRQTVNQPVRDIRYVDQVQTYYTQRFRTDTENRTYTRLVPSTQYECVARLHDWWRLFGQPYVAYHNEPYTTWHRATETRAVPVTRREVIPQQRTVKVAMPYLRMEPRQVETTVAVGPARIPQTQVAATPARVPAPTTTPTPPQQLPAPTPQLPNPVAQQQPTYVPPAQTNPQYAAPTTLPLRMPVSQQAQAPPAGPVPRYSTDISRTTPQPNVTTPIPPSLPRPRIPNYVPPNRNFQATGSGMADPYSNRGFPNETGFRQLQLPNPALGANRAATGTVGQSNGLRGFGSLGSAKHLDVRTPSNTATAPRSFNFQSAPQNPQAAAGNYGSNPNYNYRNNPYGQPSASRYGGIARLDGDPPREGTTISRDGTFQAKRQ